MKKLPDPIDEGFFKNTMNEVQAEIIALMQQQASEEGYNLTSLKGVRLLRANRALARTPVLYDPGVVIVCQGTKKGYWGNRCFIYDAEHFLAVSVPVPFTMETEASAEKPLLAIYLHLDFSLVAETTLALDASGSSALRAQPETMVSSKMNSDLSDTVLRLLRALSASPKAEVLGPLLLRELYFYLLTSEQGSVIRSALTAQGRFNDISESLKYIHQHYAKPLNLSQLSAIANMSQPTLHTHFKHITGTTPLQYIKSVRLHQARMLMVRQSLTAVEAGLAVGYESASQFNREFKRQFNASPAKEPKRMREEFAIPPEQEAALYISSH